MISPDDLLTPKEAAPLLGFEDVGWFIQLFFPKDAPPLIEAMIVQHKRKRIIRIRRRAIDAYVESAMQRPA